MNMTWITVSNVLSPFSVYISGYSTMMKMFTVWVTVVLFLTLGMNIVGGMKTTENGEC